MLQDIFPHSFNHSYMRCTPTDDSLVFVYSAGYFLLSPSKASSAYLPCYAELPDQIKTHSVQYLFAIDNAAIFLLDLDRAIFLSLCWKCCPVTTAIKEAPSWMPLVVITAAQLSHWYQNHKYCSRCGHSLSHSVTERALECQRCQIIEYPIVLEYRELADAR